MFEKFLQDIGLNEKEASVYLALLQTDTASVIELGKKTDINRTTVYTVLDSLAQKGLVSETTVGKKTHYQAEAPERLKSFVESQKIILEERQARLDDIIPQIRSIRKEEGTKPIVRYLEGKEGMISAFEDLYGQKPDGSPTYLVYSNDAISNIFTEEERKKFRAIRIGNKVKSKVLYTWKEGIRQSDEMGERIKIDENKYPVSCEIEIYQNTIRFSIIGKKTPSAIFIRSTELAETLKSVFNVAFDQLKNK